VQIQIQKKIVGIIFCFHSLFALGGMLFESPLPKSIKIVYAQKLQTYSIEQLRRQFSSTLSVQKRELIIKELASRTLKIALPELERLEKKLSQKISQEKKKEDPSTQTLRAYVMVTKNRISPKTEKEKIAFLEKLLASKESFLISEAACELSNMGTNFARDVLFRHEKSKKEGITIKTCRLKIDIRGLSNEEAIKLLLESAKATIRKTDGKDLLIAEKTLLLKPLYKINLMAIITPKIDTLNQQNHPLSLVDSKYKEFLEEISRDTQIMRLRGLIGSRCCVRTNLMNQLNQFYKTSNPKFDGVLHLIIQTIAAQRIEEATPLLVENINLIVKPTYQDSGIPPKMLYPAATALVKIGGRNLIPLLFKKIESTDDKKTLSLCAWVLKGFLGTSNPNIS